MDTFTAYFYGSTAVIFIVLLYIAFELFRLKRKIHKQIEIENYQR